MILDKVDLIENAHAIAPVQVLPARSTRKKVSRHLAGEREMTSWSCQEETLEDRHIDSQDLLLAIDYTLSVVQNGLSGSSPVLISNDFSST